MQRRIETNGAAPRGRRRQLGRRAAGAVAVLTAATVVAGLAPGTASAAAPEVRFATGLQPTPGHVSSTTGTSRLAAAADAAGGAIRPAATLPAAVDLTGFAVPPGDQGQHGACVSWTTAYTIAGWESNYTHHAGAPFAPMYVYNQVNGGTDDQGTYFDDNFAVLESQGVAEAAAWTHDFADYTSQPTADERANAALHVMTPHTTLWQTYPNGPGASARTAIETAIANNRPVGIALPIYYNFFLLDRSHYTWTAADVAADSTEFEGWHAVTVLGYDASGVTIENSWGPSWGNRGFAKLGWDFVQQYVDEAYAAGTFTPNGLLPSVTGLSTSTVSAAGGTWLDVDASRLASVDTNSPSAVRFVSVADPSVAVDAPVVDEWDGGLSVATPALPATGEYRVVVTGYNGASVPNGTADVVTADDAAAVALAPGQLGNPGAGTWVTVTGPNFGATASDFAAQSGSATVDGWGTDVTYVDPTHIQVYADAYPAGTTVPVVVTLGGVASRALALVYPPPAPVVGAVRPDRIADAGGARVTVTVTDGAALLRSPLLARPQVTLVAATDPTVRVPATVTAVSGATLTVTAPALAAGAPRDYDVVVTGGGGASTAVLADRIGYRTPLSGRPALATMSATGGAISVTGSGFGSTATAFAANRITATVNGRAAAVRWASDRSLAVTVPSGTPGRVPSIVLLHDSVPGPAFNGPRYVAVLTRNTVPRGPSRGWTTAVNGIWFNGSTNWSLVDGAGRRVAALPRVASSAALSTARYGVLVTSSATALVKLPPMALGTYRLAFTPNASLFPGSTYGYYAPATVVYYRR